MDRVGGAVSLAIVNAIRGGFCETRPNRVCPNLCNGLDILTTRPESTNQPHRKHTYPYMSTGISGIPSRLALRTRAARKDIGHWTRVRAAHVHDLAAIPSATNPAVPMLKQANSRFMAEQSSVPPKKKPLVAKDLFSSSSPSASHDGNIEQHSKKPVYSFFGSQTSRRPNKTEAPLRQRSPNARPSATSFQSLPVVVKTGQAKFASLYKQSSFQDSSNVIDLVDDDSQGLSQGGASSRYVAGVLINDDDFDDDLDLDDLDIPVVSLPTLPPPARQEANTSSNDNPPPATATSTLSWSQSSPSHLAPRQLFQSGPSATRGLNKRDAPEQDSSPIVPAKKRTLPHNWQAQKIEGEGVAVVSRNTSNASRDAMWNASASAVKAQKKQLKTQQRKPFENPHERSERSKTPAAPAPSKSQPAKAAAITLSREQLQVRELVVEKGASVFFTGPAGTGKSVLMRTIISDMKRKYARDPERVAVTASTGLAACNIGGMTLHSFSGIGLGKEDVATLVKKIRRNPKAKNRWLRTKVLIMDEVSMVDGDLFDKLSQIGRTIRNDGRPWGGIQLVITGDFFQLPPVPDSKQAQSKFAFEAATWRTSIDHTIGLTEVFRQRDPGEFRQGVQLFTFIHTNSFQCSPTC